VFYFCPRHPDFGSTGECRSRMQAPGLILDSARDMHLDLASPYLAGEKRTGVQAESAAGVTPILGGTGHGATERRYMPEQVEYADDPLGAVSHIRSRTKSVRRQSPGLPL